MSAPTLTPADAPAAAPSAGSNLLRKLAATPEAGVVLACLVAFIGFSIAAPTYYSTDNLQVMGRDLAEFGILAIGESFVILTGGIDLSVGGLAGFAGILAGWFNVNEGLPGPVAIVLTLAVCAAIGLWHGTMVNKLNVPPFVITLVTFTICKGLALSVTSGTPITGMSNIFGDLSLYYVGPVPVPALIFLVVAVATWFALERTYVGRQIYAVGGNAEAARLAGIPVKRRVTSTYVVSSTLAGLVGILIIGRLGVADPSVAASGYELTAIAAAVVGGVSLFGGEGRIVGIAAGAILLELITNGLNAVNVSEYYQTVAQGVVLGVAILADRIRAQYFGGSRR
ncbi:ABC transporter permease [Actinospica sp. MGRD01-02]|uniref:Autoinducer 2 import system permease protein LsrD n=1 Tax=Actinospica acidithermotolerans TaxID=2828514 RepID=A0A941IGT4_9ACTN|nr:ABC transporter permease [Actinospica acidithermotolerans]MBR7827760.1 ABC transporter permease [Actinospica acidithermotolerans]